MAVEEVAVDPAWIGQVITSGEEGEEGRGALTMSLRIKLDASCLCSLAAHSRLLRGPTEEIGVTS